MRRQTTSCTQGICGLDTLQSARDLNKRVSSRSAEAPGRFLIVAVIGGERLVYNEELLGPKWRSSLFRHRCDHLIVIILSVEASQHGCDSLVLAEGHALTSADAPG